MSKSLSSGRSDASGRILASWQATVVTALVLLGAVLVGCGTEGAKEELLIETASSDLLGVPTTFWAGVPPQISVCWEPMTLNDASLSVQRQWIEDAVRQNWNRFARLNLIATGGMSTWQACTPGQGGLHLFIGTSTQECGGCNGDGDPAVLVTPSGCGLKGTELDGMDFGIRLPSDQCITAFPEVQRKSHVQRVALHEIGHGLGFLHEEERGVTFCPPQAPSMSGTTFGAYDCNTNDCSVMSQCPRYDVGTVSPGDIAAIQRAYGRRIRGQMVSTYGRCLFTTGDAIGQVAANWDCDEFQDDQEWDYTFANHKLSVFNRSDLCLGVTTASSVPKLRSCTPSTDANGIQWRFQNTALRSYGTCMDLAGGNTNGGLVQSWRCGTTTNGIPDPNGTNLNQRWTFTQAAIPEIKFGGPSSTSCLTVPASGTGQLTVTACNGSNRQKFRMANADHQIVSDAFPTKCLDIASVTDAAYMQGEGLPANGSPISLFTCLSAQFNQKWSFSGEVFNILKSQCLKRNSEGNGAGLTTAACDGSLLQKFDYYPL